MSDDYAFNTISDELDDAEAELAAMMAEIDQLISGAEFLELCKESLEKFQDQLSTVAAVTKARLSNAEDIDSDFRYGMCWIGAVAAYEGHMHRVFLGILRVRTLKEKIVSFCLARIASGRKPHASMKTGSIEEITVWLTKRTATDPQKVAGNLNEIFGIETPQVDPAFSDRLLNIRAAYAHRGGGVPLSEAQVLQLLRQLEAFACDYTLRLTNEIQTLL